MVIITASRSTAPSPASSSREASPRTDEYAGDGPFRRDETGRASNACGTVGVSTRGRDAGDARISINTVDNDRLNREYRVFARVVSGMDVVDRILEGAVIARVELVFDGPGIRPAAASAGPASPPNQ
ncbi:MAG: Cyclophilin type peptidyl-prolyl cis-trans isomerase [Candidatus Aminicenantes bacterium ADurb.Bin147]|jgi:Peptidyl-prolyl cis-trans isomerase (rotamase) - cyclophilin family|nr:MAG: Cyclophilin type peptidyl-prolyl cis-trans isomerase [Candidatus Aminicenantes bacterium ADurb.Bin147]HNT31470.1 peptidylprolyl isomerase [Candidatus Aminicenantes bacterium]